MNTAPLRGRLAEWGLALLIAVALLGLLNAFVIRWVTVRSTSMYATLLPGDVLAVERWPVWTGLERGDIIVFRDPVQDDRPERKRQLLVKRVAGLPGDVVEIRRGVLLVNGKAVPEPAGATSLWTVRLREGRDATGILNTLCLPADYVLAGRSLVDLPLNDALADSLRQRPEVLSVGRHSPEVGASAHLFPFSPNYRWSNDNYGPLRVPAAGDTVALSTFTLPLYDRIITRYEANKVEVSGGKLQVNDAPAVRYTIRQDYYFVLGDSRDNSSDSRYWGFLPADQVVGRAGLILLNARSLSGRSVPLRAIKAL
jgi:signal peptidase I